MGWSAAALWAGHGPKKIPTESSIGLPDVCRSLDSLKDVIRLGGLHVLLGCVPRLPRSRDGVVGLGQPEHQEAAASR